MPEDQNLDNNLNNNQDSNEDNHPQEDNQENTEDTIEERDPVSFDYNLIEDDVEDNTKDVNNKEDNTEDKKTIITKPKNNKALDAINQMRVDSAVKNGISDYFENNPEAKQYQNMVEKFVKHPERMRFIKNGLPVSAVIAEALAPYQQRIGALKAQQADEEANRMKDGGNGKHPQQPGNIDYSKMSNNDIRKMARDVISGRFNK